MSLLKKLPCLILFGIYIFSLSSCQRIELYGSSEFVDFDHSGFTPGKEYLFVPFENLVDSQFKDSLFNVSVAIRYSANCPLKSVPLSVEYYSPEVDSIVNLKINVNLFGKDNDPLGKGHYGIYELLFPLLKEMKPIEDFTISLMSQQANGEGIAAFGVVADPVSKHF